MPRRDRTVSRVWPAGSEAAAAAATPRDDVVTEEAAGEGTFVQALGPFTHYRRTVATRADGAVEERTTYRLQLPWFGWLFGLPIRHALTHRRPPGAPSPFWAPPDRLSERQARTLALLAAASMSAAFANTLFTQTATFAAKRFDVGDFGQGVGGAVVRLGVVITIPFAFLADRLGRRRTTVWLAWLTPVLCAVGALAPSFAALVASQTVARPLGLALSLIAVVAAAEDMPKNSRAYALSVLAMAAGLGAGIAVLSLRLADLGDDGWRLVYVVSLVWLPVAVSLLNGLLETRRFETVHRVGGRFDKRRLALVAGVALTSNLFVAPASYFQNRYLEDVRGYSAGGIALFTLLTGTPASIGLILGGRIADVTGRRRLIAVCTPLSTACLVLGFMTSGTTMWAMALLGGLSAAMAYPAYAVYRTELFPTGNRGFANGLVTATALLSGSLGLLWVGWARDHGWSFGQVIALVGVGQLVAAWLAFRHYPETAHLELEQLNPEDPAVDLR